MRTYEFAADFTAAEEGGFVVTFLDLPEAITQGETIEECIEEAVDVLDEAITARINTGRPIPSASPSQKGQYLIPVPTQTAFKAALYEEITARGLSKVELAAKLGIDEKEVRRLLNPHHATKLPRIAEILGRVGKKVVLTVEEPAELLVRA